MHVQQYLRMNKNYGLFCDCLVIEYLIVNGERHDLEENSQSA